MKKLYKYRVQATDAKGLIMFNREGSFYGDEDALNYFYDIYLGYTPLTNTVNLAFALSGGLTRNKFISPDEIPTKIKLSNITLGKVVEVDYKAEVCG